MVPSVKGNLLNFNREFIIEKFGQEAFNKLLEQLTPEDRAIYSKSIFGASWLPETAHGNFIAAAEKMFGKGDYELCKEMGMHAANTSIPKIYKIFVRFGNPAFVIKNSAIFWKQLHNHGHLEVKLTSPKSTLTHLIDFQTPNKAFCMSLAGFFIATLQMCGCKNIKVWQTKCAADGADCCEFPGSWE